MQCYGSRIKVYGEKMVQQKVWSFPKLGHVKNHRETLKQGDQRMTLPAAGKESLN